MSALPVPTGVSPSSIDKYENCPLSFRLFTIEKIPDPPGRAAVLGTFVHRVLERLFADPPEHRTLERSRDHARHTAAELDDDADYVGLGLDDAGRRQFKWDAWRMVEGYFALENPGDIVPEPGGLERWVRGTIDNVPVRGIIDRLERSPAGGLVISDYKTGKPPAKTYAKERLKAMQIYALLLEHETGERADVLRLLYLAGPTTVEGTVTDKVLHAAQDRIVRAWDGITTDCERGHFEARPNVLCDWCAAKPHCPAWGGDLDVAVKLGRRLAGAPALTQGS